MVASEDTKLQLESKSGLKSWEWVSPSSKDELEILLKSHGDRADRILTAMIGVKHPEISRSRLQVLFEKGFVLCNGKVITSSSISIQSNQKWQIQFPPSERSELQAVDLPLEILFEDENLAVINKPAGIVTHPAPTVKGPTLVEILLGKLKSLSQIGGVERPGIVHRLDQWTSGVMVISKTDRAHHLLQDLFAKHSIERRYQALTYGKLPQARVTLKSLIGRHPQERHRMTTEVERGREAITHFQQINVFFSSTHFTSTAPDISPAARRDPWQPGSPIASPVASLTEAQLETGRTHQVRVHLAKLGCSVLGDPLYGVPSERSEKWKSLPQPLREYLHTKPGQLLQARVLGFTHPLTNKILRFEIPLDNRIQKAISFFSSENNTISNSEKI